MYYKSRTYDLIKNFLHIAGIFKIYKKVQVLYKSCTFLFTKDVRVVIDREKKIHFNSSDNLVSISYDSMISFLMKKSLRIRAKYYFQGMACLKELILFLSQLVL